jgi:hypothetical protein
MRQDGSGILWLSTHTALSVRYNTSEIRIPAPQGGQMLATELTAGLDYAHRPKPQDPGCRLQKVRFIGPARAGKAKVSHRDGEFDGLEEWVPTRTLLCRWAERSPFLRDESRWAALQQAAARDRRATGKASVWTGASARELCGGERATLRCRPPAWTGSRSARRSIPCVTAPLISGAEAADRLARRIKSRAPASRAVVMSWRGLSPLVRPPRAEPAIVTSVHAHARGNDPPMTSHRARPGLLCTRSAVRFAGRYPSAEVGDQ